MGELLKIYQADTIHDWGARNSSRVSNLTIRPIVKNYLSDIGIDLDSYNHNTDGISFNAIENTFTDYVVGLNNYATIDDTNTLDLTSTGTTIVDFGGKSDNNGCKSMRVILAESATPNTPLQYDEIGKSIFKFFGVSDPNGELHLIIDAAPGKLNSEIYKQGRSTLSDRLKINQNALNIADSAITQTSAANITNTSFPFHNGLVNGIPQTIIQPYPAIGLYELNNWSLTDIAMNNWSPNDIVMNGGVPPDNFIFAYYTNTPPQTAVNWNELPFHEDAYHISMRVGITTVKGNSDNLITNLPLWESYFVQSNNDKIKTKQGASINTLSGLIYQIHKNVSPLKSINTKEFDLSPILNELRTWLSNKNVSEDKIKRILVSFIFDYKRSGDHEQVLSCKLMSEQETRNIHAGIQPPTGYLPITYLLSTGDQLCALWARYNKVSCIWHHDHKMDLYSFHKDYASKRRTLRLNMLTSAEKLFTGNLTKLQTLEQTVTVVDILKRNIIDNAKYINLESVIIFNKYLNTIIHEINAINAIDFFKGHYERLIGVCAGLIADINKSTNTHPNANLDDLEKVNPNDANIVKLTGWSVPIDKYASIVVKILSEPPTSTFIKDVEKDINIFGFTLNDHIILRAKYGILKKIHKKYTTDIINSWPKGTTTRPYDKPAYDNPEYIEGASPGSVSHTFYVINRHTPPKKESSIDTGVKYDIATSQFLINKNGEKIFEEILVFIGQIQNMNSVFTNQPTVQVPISDVTFDIRPNCHNTGGSYYNINKLTDFLKPPGYENMWVYDWTGMDGLDGDGVSGNIFQAAPPPSSGGNYYGGNYEMAGGSWEMDDYSEIGGLDGDLLIPASSSNFIDYIEDIKSNIKSILKLDDVGENASPEDFKSYIFNSAIEVYSRYNQTNFNPKWVYNLLLQLDVECAYIYKYSLFVHEKYTPQEIEFYDDDYAMAGGLNTPIPTPYRTIRSYTPNDYNSRKRSRRSEESYDSSESDNNIIVLPKDPKSQKLRRGAEKHPLSYSSESGHKHYKPDVNFQDRLHVKQLEHAYSFIPDKKEDFYNSSEVLKLVKNFSAYNITSHDNIRISTMTAAYYNNMKTLPESTPMETSGGGQINNCNMRFATPYKHKHKNIATKTYKRGKKTRKMHFATTRYNHKHKHIATKTYKRGKKTTRKRRG